MDLEDDLVSLASERRPRSLKSEGTFDLRSWAAKLTSFETFEEYEYVDEPEELEEMRKQNRRRRRSIILCSLVMLLFIGGVVAISILAIPDNKGKKVDGIESGDGVETGKLVDSTSSLKKRIQAMALNGGSELDDPTSYQSQALQYLEEVPGIDSHTDMQLTQKYSLACFFYATNGVKNTYNENPTGWKKRYNWLEADEECSWYGIECVGGAIFSIDLENNNVLGSVPREIALLGPSLKSLDLSRNGISSIGEEMDWLAELTSLRNVRLHMSNFDSDGLPTYLGQLTLLEQLDVSYTLMFGSFNAEAIFPSLTNLRTLELSGNIYEESVPMEIVTLPKLEHLYIEYAHVVDDLSFLPLMPVISELWLDYNENIKGTIPKEIGTITSLKSFSIAECSISGTIPSEIGLLTGMVQMWLHENQLTGKIPMSIEDLPDLNILHLEGNHLEGIVPRGICRDTIESLGSDCLKVDCACCTCCESPCNVSETQVTSVERIILNNAINGGDEFKDNKSPQSRALKWVKLVHKPEHGLDRIIQRYVLATIWYSTYKVDNLYTKKPTPAWTDTEGWLTSYHECDWYGVSCTPNNEVDSISLNYNGLTGRFPQEVRLLADTLIHLDLSGNSVYNYGEQLSWLEDLTQLTQLEVHLCNFDWTGIPPYLSSLTNLEILDISYTLFHGPLDGKIFENLDKLWLLEMGGNSYNSPMPAEITSLPELEYLYAEYTDLMGDLSIFDGMNAIIEVWLDDNQITGTMPTSIGDVLTLKSISMSHNQIAGAIPSSIGNLVDLQQMWLFGNQLTGYVPNELKQLTNLHTLHLEDNNLEGTIASDMCLPFLTTFVTDCVNRVSCSCCTNCY